MLNPSNLSLIHSGYSAKDQIIDSYELIKSIILEFEGQASLKIKVDNTLPIIKGDLVKLKELFTVFIGKAITQLEEHVEEINLVHIKNTRSWVFAILFHDFQSEVQEVREKSLAVTMDDFILAIPFSKA